MFRPEFDMIPERALEWHRAGGAALATVVQTWGSAPRPVGSQLAINKKEEIAGSVSGGCVEGAVVAEAGLVQRSGKSRILEFGVADEDAFAVGLACGGRIRVLVEAVGGNQGLSENHLEKLVEQRRNRVPTALLVNTRTWEHALSDGKSGQLASAIQSRMRLENSGFEGDWFVGIHSPPLRMIVVGGVHIAQPLIKFAELSGYDVYLVDPREAFASPSRFPDIVTSHDWPDEAIKEIGADSRTAIVTLTHDPKIDDPAIDEALASEAFYIGCLGSNRTHGKRMERLRSRGHSEDGLARIDAPVGLDIGSRTPAEIATSIMAEVTLRLRKGNKVA